MGKILVVDDEVGIRELLSEILREEGHEVSLAENASKARERFTIFSPDLVLLDIWMPDSDGVTLLKEWSSTGALTMPVIMMSGHGTIDTAVEATKMGAFSYLEKPIALQKLLATVTGALSRAPKNTGSATYVSLGKSDVVADLKRQLEALRGGNAPVFLREQPGSGADQCVQILVNRGSKLLEIDSEQAYDEKIGLLNKEFSKGAIYFREISRLTSTQQLDLLARVPELLKRGVRVFASSSVSLNDLARQRLFDVKLLESLSVTTITVPPLSNRRDDIIEIAKAMLFVISPTKYFSAAALNKLRSEEWPANIVQLHAAVTTSAEVAKSEEIGVREIELTIEKIGAAEKRNLEEAFNFDVDYRAAREDFERRYLEYHLSREGGNMSRIAKKAGLERTHLYRKLKQLGLKVQKKIEE
jgi:two-component system nitrogen regulation response regulator NtrX